MHTNATQLDKKGIGLDNSHQHRILSAVRGRLRQVAASLQAAVRFRRFSRRGTTAPDWFVDKSHQEDNADVGEEPQHGCWGYRVVFDPALPIYYKKKSESECGEVKVGPFTKEES
ncbi:hypothetical protein HUJ04_008428 [Dendroctonus ponderosae]|nr:hypothetical protein HUJ04_008428 [Dendroctonus ponderosae]